MTNTVHTTLTKLRALLIRVGQLGLPPDEEAVLRAVLSKEIARCERRQIRMAEKAAAQEAAHDEVGGVDEDGIAPSGPSGDCGDPACCDPSEDAPVSPNNSPSAGTKPPKRKGHGRNGAGAYANAEHVHHELLDGVVGAICEACGLGRMSRYREKLIVAIKGQPLFGATVHHFEQARCKLCGAIIGAEGPAVVDQGLGSSYITYEWSACAMLAVMHYFAGLPFKRIESLQAGWGIPMPDANLWSLADQGAELLHPLYTALERFGIQNATALRIDDTGSMVIELRREIRAEIAALEALGESTNEVRTGINATGVYLETEQGKVLLFFTGRHHAGEIIDQILTHRGPAESDGGRKLVKVSDAASKNFSHAHGDALEEAVCNAHAYLKFRAVRKQYSEEHRLAGEVYEKVFGNDDLTKAQGMSPHERMLYHRTHSLPEMKRLKKMCSDKLTSKLVEPNSPLWEPITFIINQWDRLTRFCNVPDTPLDTNVVEQMLIIPVRYLAASFNYRSREGAEVGDLYMSVVGTANANGVEPVAYLEECLANHEDLAQRPEHYLPWAYRARVEARKQNASTGPPASSSQPSTKDRGVQHPLRPGLARSFGPSTSSTLPTVA